MALRLGKESRAGLEPVEGALGALEAKLEAAKAAAEEAHAMERLRGLALCQGHTYFGGPLLQHGRMGARVEDGSRLVTRFPGPPSDAAGQHLRRLAHTPAQLVLQAKAMEGGGGGGGGGGAHVLAALLLPPRLSEMCVGALGGQLLQAALEHNPQRFRTEEQLLSHRAASLDGYTVLGEVCRANQVGLLCWLLRSGFLAGSKAAANALKDAGKCTVQEELGSVSEWSLTEALLPPGNRWLQEVQRWREAPWEDGPLRQELQPTAFELALCHSSLETAAVLACAQPHPPPLLEDFDNDYPNLVHAYPPGAWPEAAFPVWPWDADQPCWGGGDAAGTGNERYFAENAAPLRARLQLFLRRLAAARCVSAQREGADRLTLYVRGVGPEATRQGLQALFAAAAGAGEPAPEVTLLEGACKVAFKSPAVAARVRWAVTGKAHGANGGSRLYAALARKPVGGGGRGGHHGRGRGRGGGPGW